MALTAQDIETLRSAVKKLSGDSKEANELIEKLAGQFSQLSSAGREHLRTLSEKFEEFRKTLFNGNVDAQTFTKALKSIGEAGEEALRKLAGGFSGFAMMAQATQEALDKVHKKIAELNSEEIAVATNASRMAVEMAATGAAFAPFMPMPRVFSEMSSEVSKFHNVYNGVIESIPVFGKAFSHMFEEFEYGKAFENQIVGMAAKSGDLRKILGPDLIAGKELNIKMDEVMNKMVTSVRTSSDAMGIGMQEGMKRSFEIMGSLPGQMMKSHEVAGNLVSSMQLLSTVSQGTGLSFETIKNVSEEMFNLWGGDAVQKGAERLSIMSVYANNLNIPFEKLKSHVGGIDEGFKMWGQSATGVLETLKEVNEVLQKQGLGYGASLEITQKLASSIRDMSIEKKAFLALSSGVGGTPLHGGLEVEKMIQEGQWDKVTSMLQGAISNIGGAGRVVSLQEATSTPGMESAFMAQRQALGMFGISDTGTANRLMDVMSQIQLGTTSGIDQQKAMEDAFKQGTSIQDRQYNELVRLANKVDTGTIQVALQGYEKGRDLIGTHGVVTEAIEGKSMGFETRMKDVAGARPENTLGEWEGVSKKITDILGDDLLVMVHRIKDVLSETGMQGIINKAGLSSSGGKMEISDNFVTTQLQENARQHHEGTEGTRRNPITGAVMGISQTAPTIPIVGTPEEGGPANGEKTYNFSINNVLETGEKLKSTFVSVIVNAVGRVMGITTSQGDGQMPNIDGT